MIQADAHTNPFTWRRCVHVLVADRCTNCGAVTIEASVYGEFHHKRPSVASPTAGNSDYSIRETPRQAPPKCPQGHDRRWHTSMGPKGEPYLRPTCDTCAAERRAARLQRCPRGHEGESYQSPSGKYRCNRCSREDRRKEPAYA